MPRFERIGKRMSLKAQLRTLKQLLRQLESRAQHEFKRGYVAGRQDAANPDAPPLPPNQKMVDEKPAT